MRTLRFLQLGLAAQVPFTPEPQISLAPMSIPFTLKDGADSLSPRDMLTLPRPGVPLPNDIGDLTLVPISTYSFQDRKYAHCPFLFLQSLKPNLGLTSHSPLSLSMMVARTTFPYPTAATPSGLTHAPLPTSLQRTISRVFTLSQSPLPPSPPIPLLSQDPSPSQPPAHSATVPPRSASCSPRTCILMGSLKP